MNFSVCVRRADVREWEDLGCHTTQQGHVRCTCATDLCNAPFSSAAAAAAAADKGDGAASAAAATHVGPAAAAVFASASFVFSAAALRSAVAV